MSAQRITTDEFKKILKSDSPIVAYDSIVIRAAPGVVSEAPSAPRTLLWCISTETPDRMGDIIKVSGWRLDNYNRGGSVLWAHEPKMLPVGKPTTTYIRNDALYSECQYPTKEENAFADSVYLLAKGGYLRGASIGMRPIKYEVDHARVSDEYPCPMVFVDQELLEWSHTPIPANPEALVQAKGYGIDLNPIKSWCEQVLDTDIAVLGLNRATIEKAYGFTTPAVIMSVGGIDKDTNTEGVDPVTATAPSLAPEQCNNMLREVLSASDIFMTVCTDGQLDMSNAEQCRALMERLLDHHTAMNAPDESGDDTANEDDAQSTPDESNEYEGRGIDAYDSHSFEDLTEQDIREVMKDVMSKYIGNNKIKIRPPMGR